jgi:ribosome-binding protein aMBF1 (putative translation factor)
MAEKVKKDKIHLTPEAPEAPEASEASEAPEVCIPTQDATQTALTVAPVPSVPTISEVMEDPEDYATVLEMAKNKLGLALEELTTKLVRPEEQEDIRKLISQSSFNTQGLEEMDDRWSIPIIRVVQGMTREKPNNANVGDLYTTAGDVIKGNVELTPLYIYENNRMFPQDNKGPVCHAPDAKLGSLFGYCRQCANLPMGKNATGQSTDCDNGVCALVLSSDMKLYRLEFYRTSKKAGRQLYTYAKQSPAAWNKWYALSTVQQKNEKDNYGVLKIVSTGKETSMHVREASLALYEMINAERKAFLKQHYAQAFSGTAAISQIDESVDFLPGVKKEINNGVINADDLSDAGI